MRPTARPTAAQINRSFFFRCATTGAATPAAEPPSCDPLELHAHVVRGLPAVVGILGETASADAIERRRRHRRDRRDRRRLGPHDRGDRARPGSSPRKPSGPSPSRRARCRTRRCRCARPPPCPRAAPAPCTGTCRGSCPPAVRFEPICVGSAVSEARRSRARHRHRLGETEVEELHPGPRQHHVARLQVTMHDPGAVRFVERVRDLGAEAQHLFERERALQQPVRQRLALQVLHDEVLGLALPAHVVERADVRVRQLRDRLRFALETLAGLGRRRQVRRQHLDRHRRARDACRAPGRPLPSRPRRSARRARTVRDGTPR